MDRTAMPEASVDKDGHAVRPEDDVCFAAEVWEWALMHAIPKPSMMKLGPQGAFDRGIALPLPEHSLTRFRRRRRRGACLTLTGHPS